MTGVPQMTFTASQTQRNSLLGWADPKAQKINAKVLAKTLQLASSKPAKYKHLNETFITGPQPAPSFKSRPNPSQNQIPKAHALDDPLCGSELDRANPAGPACQVDFVVSSVGASCDSIEPSNQKLRKVVQSRGAEKSRSSLLL